MGVRVSAKGPDRRFYSGPGIAVFLREDYRTEGGLSLSAVFGVDHAAGEIQSARSIFPYSETQFGAGGSIGWRIPLSDVSAVRLAAAHGHWRETEQLYGFSTTLP